MTPEQPPLEDFFSNRAFDVVMRGYARNQVDDYVSQVESSVKQLRDHNSELNEALQTTQKKVDEQAKPSYAGLGGRVEQLLRLAEDESTDVVRRARTEAEQLREQVAGKAKRDAEGAEKRRSQQQSDLTAEVKRKREEVDREVEEKRKAATTEVEEKRKAATNEAERLVGESKKKAEQLVRLAKEDSDRIRGEAEKHASAVRAETEQQLAELDERKDAVNTQMEQLRKLLGGAAPVNVGASRGAKGGEAHTQPTEPLQRDEKKAPQQGGSQTPAQGNAKGSPQSPSSGNQAGSKTGTPGGAPRPQGDRGDRPHAQAVPQSGPKGGTGQQR
ncbi:MAG: DivIVA domain-containing protein [Streptosporangiales bacterium]